MILASSYWLSKQNKNITQVEIADFIARVPPIFQENLPKVPHRRDFFNNQSGIVKIEEMGIPSCYFNSMQPNKKGISMNNYSKLSLKIKQQIFQYAERMSEGLDKTARRTIIEISPGVMHSGQSLLTEISRCLKEDIPIKKTVERLRRNLKKKTMASYLAA